MVKTRTIFNVAKKRGHWVPRKRHEPITINTLKIQRFSWKRQCQEISDIPGTNEPGHTQKQREWWRHVLDGR
jgi:hypothetical protein